MPDELRVALREIEKARRARDRSYRKANTELVDLIGAAREAGSTWPAIAEALGMTRQGVRLFLQRWDYR
jgi:hypothetical protein